MIKEIENYTGWLLEKVMKKMPPITNKVKEHELLFREIVTEELSAAFLEFKDILGDVIMMERLIRNTNENIRLKANLLAINLSSSKAASIIYEVTSELENMKIIPLEEFLKWNNISISQLNIGLDDGKHVLKVGDCVVATIDKKLLGGTTLETSKNIASCKAICFKLIPGSAILPCCMESKSRWEEVAIF